MSHAEKAESAVVVGAAATPATGTPRVTCTVIARRHIPELDRLAGLLLSLPGPAREVVIGVETPGATEPVVERVDERGVRWLEIPPGRGIGYNRNRVLDAARGEVLVGVDDDCEPAPDWLEVLVAALDECGFAAAVGSISIPPAGFVGDSISALGFPAGGGAGYETMFRVDKDGTTTNLAAGNCAIDIATLRRLGGWDETMTFGGEDTELAHRLVCAGERIRYVPGARITHPARTNLREFTRWLYVRGRAKRQFARKVKVGKYVKMRLGSYLRILRANVTDPKIVLIVPLLAASLVIQQVGWVAEWLDPHPAGQRR